jgi:hypothetical protein
MKPPQWVSRPVAARVSLNQVLGRLYRATDYDTVPKFDVTERVGAGVCFEATPGPRLIYWSVFGLVTAPRTRG